MAVISENNGFKYHIKTTANLRTGLKSVVISTTYDHSRSPEIHQSKLDLHLSNEELDVLLEELIALRNSK